MKNDVVELVACLCCVLEAQEPRYGCCWCVYGGGVRSVGVIWYDGVPIGKVCFETCIGRRKRQYCLWRGGVSCV